MILVCGDAPSSADAARDQDDVSFRLGHTRGHSANTRLCHEFHTDTAIRIDLLQVIDQLSQIFDRIDIMMRGRADQRHARRRSAGSWR